ncbi:MAG: aminotransferase [Limnothrix sp. RL_2_0]|nr:aminotransferase [Limnothrix sp. RL_2_0]
MGYWYAGKWFDGDQISLSIADPSLLFGATIFTTLRVYEGSLADPRTHWQRHGDRLHHTVKSLTWPKPDWERIFVGATRVADHYPVVRITILSDGQEFISGRLLPPQLLEKQRYGIKVWVAGDRRYQRSLADFKTGNYLGVWQALQQAKAQGAGEAMLISTTGAWLETATGNLWGLAEGQWYTPPASGLLPGVMRDHLCEQLQTLGQPAIEEPWQPELIQKFEAIAYSNSVVGVIPIVEIIDVYTSIHLPEAPHLVRQLQKLAEYHL